MTKKTEAEVLKVYTIWLHAYLNGDIATYNEYLDKDYHFIGSTDNEEFLNKNDTTRFFEATADQLAGKCDLRNETKIIEEFEGLVFITHLFDAWFLTDSDWAYYGRFRFTNALRKNKNGWRFIYQHFSTTDSKTDEGETIGFDKVNAENQELREAIKRRTFELEEKNRELEVEGALDRIRAEAVAMQQSSDLLDIVVTMRNEFTKLGHEAHYFWHMMWLPETYEKAMTSGDGSKIGFVMELPRHMHGDIPQLAKWEKSKKSTVIYPMNVKEAIAYVDKMVALGDFKNIDPQAPTHEDIKHIGGLTFIMARTSHGEIGYSLPGVIRNPPKADIDILIQFAGAFDLAHRRFLDLQKAEKQAREVQIELGLEKVRSRTMAMQHSDELAEASFLLDKQVRELGIKTWGCAFNIYGEKESTEWFGNEAGVLHTYTVPREGIFKEYYNKGQKGETLFIQEFSGEECIAHYEYMSSLPVIGDVLKTLKETNNGFPTYQIDHVVYFKYGYLLFITRESVPDAHDIFIRFAKVFEQTYTRFLDLQKAEAQAREAQIEAALERLRSRSMAMQKSDELLETGALLYKELNKLGVDNLTTGYVLFNANTEIGYSYGVNPVDGSIRDFPVEMPHNETSIMKSIVKSWKNEEPSLIIELNEEETIKHQTFIAERSKNFPISAEQLLAISPERLKIHIFNFKQGYLLLIGSKLLTEIEQKLVVRFAKVFEQTYTRFLDLQKAEAQAREAQIEMALEKVRSRTMAMQHSEELPEAANLLFTEVQKLGIPAWSCGYNILADDKKSSICIMSSEGELQTPFVLPLTKHESLKPWYKAIKNNEDFFVYNQDGKDLVEHYDYMKSLPDLKTTFKQLEDVGLELPTQQYNHLVKFNEGFLLFITYEEVPKAHDIFKRFGKVFNQTYTRFLDLQKAEEQAREAKVEAALERVRSRSMAMHNSEEIGDVAFVLFEQLKSLGGELWGTGFGFCKKNSEVDEFWFANENGIMPHLKIPNNVDDAHKKMYQGWKKNLELFSIEKGGKELKEHYKYMLTIPDVQPIFQGMLDNGISFPKWQKWHAAYFKYGYLLIITTETYEDEGVFKRFAKVFEQAYTRFLDLQKAEAQTRTAQINLAVERVRAKALAMHKSEEILGVVSKLKDEVMALDIPDVIAATIFLKEGDDKVRMWDLSSLEKNNNGYQIPFDITFKLKKSDPNLYIKRIWENPEDYFIEIQNKKDFKRIIAWLREHNESKFASEVETFIDETQLKSLHHAVKKLNNGRLVIDSLNPPSEEMQTILTKMGAAFDLAYKRFEDLQKAEAQARESEIELGLERLRAKAMAMQNSNELSNLVATLLNELTKLDFSLTFCIINIYDEPDLSNTVWAANPEEGKAPESYYMKFEDYPFHHAMMREWKTQTPKFVYVIEGEEKEIYDEYLFTETEFRRFPKEVQDANRALDKYVASFVFSPFGGLQTVGNEPLSAESLDILYRFGKVFNQSYTRFLDLKKAEAQTRKAQIEAALERTRTQSMLMQHSNELDTTSKVFHEQLQLLGIDTEFSYVWLPDEANNEHQFWVAWNSEREGKSVVHSKAIVYPLDKTEPYTAACFKDWASDISVHIHHIKPTEVKTFFTAWEELLKDAKNLNPEYFSDGLYYAEAFMKYGCFGINIKRQISKEEKQILQRFSVEFERTYTRFLDLQKAEAQAREAQIEAALERVRSRSMAMHNSEELKDVIQVLYNQFIALKINIEHAGFILDYKNQDDMHIVLADNNAVFPEVRLPYFDCAHWNSFKKAKKNNESLFKNQLDFKEKNKFYKDLFKHIPGLPKETMMHYLNVPGLAISTVLLDSIGLYIENFKGIPYSDKENEILLRFGKVFQQTYTRFLDLQKAEVQAREATVEAAMERIRSRSMAMQKSEELNEVILEIHKKFKELDISMESRVAIVVVYNQDTKDFNQYIAAHDLSNIYISTPYFKHPVLDDYFEAKEAGVEFFSKSYSVEEKDSYFKTFFETSNLDEIEGIEDQKKWVFAQKFYTHSQAFQKNSCIGIADYTGIPLTEFEIDIIIRFSKVFDQAYTRFLDLQKAEAQARKAQIETALERIRSQSMGMQTSKDLSKVTTEMFNQLRKLGGNLFATGIVFCDKHEGHVEQWHSLPDVGMMSPFIVPIGLDYIHQYRYDEWKKGTDLFSVEIPSDFIEQHFQDIFNLPSAQKVLQDFEDQNIPMPEAPPWEIDYGASFKNGYILVSSLQPFEDAEILPRFAKVFEQTYTRYLDLKKAEKQAREAQIEAALERVRSRSMAMHKSEEMLSVIEVVSEELIQLNLSFDIVSFGKNNQQGEFKFWLTSTGQPKPVLVEVPPLDSRVQHTVKEAQKKGLNFIADVFTAEENKIWSEHLIKYSILQHFPEPVKTFILNAPGFARSSFLLKDIDLYVGNYRAVPFTDEENSIFGRFAQVFEQAYTRFLDLQKAEAQAREAQIEAAMERVRAKAMSMQNSDELDEVLSVLCEQFDVLGIVPMSTHMTVFDFENNTFTFRETGKFGNRSFGEQTVALDAMDNWKETVDKWKADEATAINKLHFPKEQLPKVWDVFHESFASMPEGSRITPEDYPDGIYHTAGKHPFGYIGMNQIRPATEEEEQIVIKFANEFGRAYQRFLDLQKAEKQAREAQIEAALERVRARAMAMHQSNELSEAAEILYQEFYKLGISTFSCGYLINDDENKHWKVWMTDANDESFKNFWTLPYSADHHLLQRYKSWKKKELFHFTLLEGEKNIKHHKVIAQFAPWKKESMGDLPDRLVLNSAHFTHGHLLIVTGELLTAEVTSILTRFATVFDQTYIRFLDLKKAEHQALLIKEEKERLEVTINDLRATQTQLIQSEKMASLGELTAGIAHEIQNPLNFVNNFSEVSKELLEEMQEEIENGDFEEVKTIMKDIIQNLEKINHHGKRADGIVKGMLQHSRASGDKKEPTDINKLADEYMRLAYHGLRAKNKQFNATLETNFDESLPKVPTVPQDIGRVILNLFTNAFYAVDEKKSNTKEKNYEPTVSVTTKQKKNNVQITVRDNANGIPEPIMDKIFQPFFTTKPTGQGTGLGLSMSYDIVKAHGGELEMTSKINTGTIFKIILPLK